MYIRQSKTSLLNQSGFFSVMALAMMGVIALVLMDIQMQTMDIYENMKSRRNYNNARTIAESQAEYLLWKMKKHEVGWNSGRIRCGFGKFANKTTMKNGIPSPFCEAEGLLFMTEPQEVGEAQKDILITMQVKGHSNDEEKIRSKRCGSTFDQACYVIPDPGTGDAGDELYCTMYNAAFIGDPNADANVPTELANGSPNLNQLDYSCNWNKLSFGSSQFDRVTIPLYYDESGVEDGSKMITPFHEDTLLGDRAQSMTVRLRTPCVPCGGTLDDGTIRDCSDKKKTRDWTVCEAHERYDLDVDDDKNTDDDDIVVQWLLNGECPDGKGGLEDCGVIAIKDKVNYPEDYSAFYESKINKINFSGMDSVIMKNSTAGYDNNDFPKTVSLIKHDKKPELFPGKLPTMSKPVLSFSLNKPLLTKIKRQNVPYLEYQILTDMPVASPRTFLEVDVVVGENGFRRTFEMDVPRPLIDFAIHTN